MKTTKNICRVCLTENGAFQSIFLAKSISGCSLHISEMISACVPIQVTEGDGLPEQICTVCAEVTVKMYLFKIKCENGDRILRAKLRIAQAENADLSVKLKIKTERDEALFEDIENYKYKTEDDQKILEMNNEIKIDYEDLALKQHNDKEEFVCDICLEKFNRIDLLTIHQTVHTIEIEKLEIKYENLNSADPPIKETKKSKFICPKCDFVFVNKDNLDKHIYDLHIKKESKVSFDVDFEREKQFTDVKSILDHNENDNTIIQMSEKSIERNVCQNKFKQLPSLKENKTLHSVKKTYDCDMCKKQFSHFSNLKRHKLTHTVEKQYECDKCGKKYGHLRSLKSHMKIHTAVKSYECDVCKTKFTYSQYLKRHKLIHTGEKPYECGTCKKRFRQLSTLNTHKKIHNEKLVWDVLKCTKYFTLDKK